MVKEASRRRRKSLGWVFARGTKERVFQAVWTAPVKVWVNEQHGAFGTPQGFFGGGGTIRSVEGSSGSGTVRRVGPRCWRSGRTEALIL